MRICSVENCPSKHYMKSFCIKHFQRFKRYGDPLKKVKRNYGEGSIDSQGYIKVEKNGKTVPMHRWLMEQHLGKKLLPSQIVHHINEDKSDNRIENLEVMDRGDHIRLHKLGIFKNANNTKTHKQCPRCKDVKERTQFNKQTTNSDGLFFCCRECQKIDNKIRRAKK